METKTTETTAVNAGPALEVTALAKGSAPAEVTRFTPKALDWTAERVELLRKQVCPPSATQGEFELFLDWCKATGLNPFIQQAYLIPRRQKVKGADGSEKWVDKHQPLAAIGGMRALVDMQPDHRGFEGGAVYAGDLFGVDQKTGAVIHQWDLETRLARGWKVIGAWGHALRAGRVTKVVFLPIESRIQSDSPFWTRDPSGQIAKCAEAAAYREGYPNALGGVFLSEEWRDDGQPFVDAGTVDSGALPAGSKTEELKERVAKAAADAKAKHDARSKPAAAKPAKPADSLPIEQVRFGKLKGKFIVDLSGLELEGILAEAEVLRPKVTGQWVAPFSEGVEAIQNEIALRERGGETSAPGVAEPTKHAVPRDGQTTAREPGSEG